MGRDNKSMIIQFLGYFLGFFITAFIILLFISEIELGKNDKKDNFDFGVDRSENSQRK